MQQVNIVAVLVAALSSFLLGGLWYSKLLFGPAWHRLAGNDGRKMAESHPAKVFGLSYLFAVTTRAPSTVQLFLIRRAMRLGGNCRGRYLLGKR